MRVDVSGQKFVFPQQCACCGSTPQTTVAAVADRTTSKRVVHTTSKSWDFPYCYQCAGHIQAAANARSTAIGSAAVALFLASMLYFASPFLGLLTFLGGTGLSFYLYSSLIAKARSCCGPSCACLETPVRYLGWQGAAQFFEIASDTYAMAFMVANMPKLINVRPEVWQWLQANGYAAQSHQPQTARRYVR